MPSTKIRSFRGLRDGKEDPTEYIEDLEWEYEQHYQTNDPMGSNKDRAMKILFRQNLDDDAYQWYAEQEAEIKQDWARLRAAFLKQYEITVRDTQAEKFELRMKVAQSEQGNDETIAEYLKRAGDIARLMVSENDQIEIGIAMLRGMKDQFKREQVNFDCNKESNYFYPNVERLIKAVYSQVGKPNPFEANTAVGIMIPQRHHATNDESALC